MWGATGVFPITLVETLMSLGVFTLMGLFFILGLKYLELLPVTREEGRETSTGIKKKMEDEG